MKENYTQLYGSEATAEKVSDYAYEHSTALPKRITDLHADVSAHHPSANYMISPLQEQFHIWTAKSIGAKRILEIGCFIGFSALGWAEAVGPDGHVTTLEFSSEFAQEAKDNLAKNNVKNVEVIIGDARESMKTLAATIKEPYDLIFIDADKSSYSTYLSLILYNSLPSSSTRILRPNGIIMADNILRRGLIADPSDDNPWAERMKKENLWREGDMKAIDEFNKAMVAEKRLDTFLMPMFDGLGMGRLVD